MRAVQVHCQHMSPHSQAEEIKPRTVSPPVLSGPLFDCAQMVRVTEILPGARVEIYQTSANGWRMIAAEQVFCPTADISVTPPLRAVAGENTVFARQIACNNPVEGERISVNSLGDLAAPVVGDCGKHLQVSGVVPGAWVEIFADDQYLQGGRSGGTTVYFDEAIRLLDGTTIKARQALCSRMSPFGNEVAVRSDVEKRRLLRISTKRVCQLTGLHNSLAAGICETDLGVVVEHDTGDGWIYFFFGDTNLKTCIIDDFPPGWDCIGRTSDRSTAQDGTELEFLYDVDDGEIRPHIFGIHNVLQEYFEVPTGGFSHAGKLYVFASTDHPTWIQPDVMGRSVLASARLASDMFQIVTGHDDISNLNRESIGEFKFINIAAQKIRNDDWAGLPDNAIDGGEGLILIGSGRYRASQPCLAYVPLIPNQDPAFSEWRYLAGFIGASSSGQLCGIPQWSSKQREALFLFDDVKTPGSNGQAGWVGELSITYAPQVELWLLLYSMPMDPPEAGGRIVLRSAEKPWGPWSQPLELFNFYLDSGQQFMKGASPYAPYIIPRFTAYDRVTRELTIHWNMSTWEAYQVMLMRSILREDCGYNDRFSCPTGH